MRPALARTIPCLVFLLGSVRLAPGGDVDFNRDVRPILSRHCFKCHGPDDQQRKAELHLDTRDSAVATAKSGRRPIVPGRPEQSELVRRIRSTDDDEVMPPPETNNPLSDLEKRFLTQWIAAGAEYKPHWAFVAPTRPALPQVKQADWPRNPIDTFVLARLEAAGLRPSPTADRHTIIRRLYLDLIGLPPTPDEADEFVNDPSPDAYEKLVDRLLSSQHYGERWARRWLDLARYADTNGYEKDRVRSIWPYRDWVIHAINSDMPFDQFTIEQIAGDLLPNAGLSHRVATGFHRNTMTNEEGGIDPLEFRFHAMTDRVNTTATVWLGLTLGCAQCHTHKFDPIPQREYYQFMAFLNNADEPEIEVPTPELAARRKEMESKIAALEADLPNRFPPEGDIRWHTPKPTIATSAGGATIEILDDQSLRVSGTNPERDSLTLVLDSELTQVSAIRLESLTDPSLGKNGPGRTPHGNFVLSEFVVSVALRDQPDKGQSVKLVRAEADFSQDAFPVAHAIDGDPKTGWAIHGKDPWNLNRSATFTCEKPMGFPGGSRWTIRLDQQHGSQHTLGHLRLSLGQTVRDSRPIELRRREHLEQRFREWFEHEASGAAHWTLLPPVESRSNLAKLEVLDDASVLASGDQTKRDVYELKFKTDLHGITALRLEALPDDRLPKRGPGRVYYEGPFGDFFLSELAVVANGRAVALSRATHSFANGVHSASAAIDGDPQTGWSISGGQGRPHTAVFNFAEPLDDGSELSVRLLFERYYAAGLGRFRISVTTDSRTAEAHRLPAEVEKLLLISHDQLSADQRERLLAHFVQVAPELAPERDSIEKLRKEMPDYPTTLVLDERPADNPRPTSIHRRGEFLQPIEPIGPDVLSALLPLPQEAPRNRLTFAYWLVDPSNPLVGRVTMNRHWATFFGRGIVRTTEDFGYQGEPPTHPELLDWLSCEFMAPSNYSTLPSLPLATSGKGSWSLKRMHRLIVTSATYRQSSRVAPELLEQDPENRLLARGPRLRLEAELLRDSALRISGLLSLKIGGPSVFPPQPESVTSEGAYGALAWKVSAGEDRYRRGLYTFSKRTAPYAMFTTFDAPSGESCVPRREVSNTPLQALTLLNDTVFVDASQALGRQLAADDSPIESRLTQLFRRSVTRPPNGEELAMLLKFYHAQKDRFTNQELDATAIAGPGDGDPVERATWTVLARAVLNLDETITKQ